MYSDRCIHNLISEPCLQGAWPEEGKRVIDTGQERTWSSLGLRSAVLKKGSCYNQREEGRGVELQPGSPAAHWAHLQMCFHHRPPHLSMKITQLSQEWREKICKLNRECDNGPREMPLCTEVHMGACIGFSLVRMYACACMHTGDCLWH